MGDNFIIDKEQFNRLFPFYIILDTQLNICSYGKSIPKLLPEISSSNEFTKLFEWERPDVAEISFDSIKSFHKNLVIIKTRTEDRIVLRGQLELIEDDNKLMLIATPWFGSMEQVNSLKLTMSDFAIHDPMIDLLHVLKTQELVTEDIKKLLNTVKKQKDQLKTLSLIAEETSNAVIITDRDGKIEWVNKAFEHTSGYHLDEIKGTKPGNFLQGKDTDPNTINYLSNQIKNAQPFECEILNYTKQQTPYWIKISGTPSFDKSGKVNQFFAMEEDITESIQAKKELEQVATRLSTVLTNLKTGILLEDENRKIIITNQEFCNIFKIRISPDALIGYDCTETAEQSKKLFKDSDKFVKRINDLLKEKKDALNEMVFMADGRVLVRDYIPIIENAKYMGHLWKYEDITQKYLTTELIKMNEEKYRGILENMELGLLEVDNDGIIVNANKSFCSISGYSLTELIGKDPLKLLVDNKKQEARIVSKTQKRKSGTISVYETSILNKNGNTINLLISGGPVFNNNKEVVGSIGIHLDISDRKKLESELVLAKNKAEESSKAKQFFLANMSHEIRTPLNAIIGLSSFMLMKNPSEEIRENLNILNFSANNLLALITDILDLSKIEAGKLDLVSSDFDLHQLIKGVYHTFLVKCDEKSIKLEYSIGKKVPQNVIGDSLRLTQVLNNLVSNAIKFTDKGGVELKVSALAFNGNTVQLLFEVKDTGIGISKKQKDVIFNEFVQADNKMTNHYGGTGLGLTISKYLIEMQGGSVGLKSKVNKGSNFFFKQHYELSFSAIDKQEVADVSNNDHSLLGKHILVVEDNVVNQRVVVSYLHHWGAETAIANNGKEAIELFNSRSFDLLIIDLYMPIMDGFETILKIRSIEGFDIISNSKKFKTPVPIVALTASAELSVVNKAIKCGADSCITKPFNATQMLSKLSELINLNQESFSVKETEVELMVVPTLKMYKWISLKRLEDASLGSKNFVLEMLTMVIDNSNLLFSDANKQLLNNDFSTFSKTIHKLKSNLLLFGLDKIKKELSFMETNAQLGKNLRAVSSTFIKIKLIWAEAEKEVLHARSNYL